MNLSAAFGLGWVGLSRGKLSKVNKALLVGLSHCQPGA